MLTARGAVVLACGLALWLVARIVGSLEKERFLLVERLAEHVAQLVMGEFKSPWVKVSVTKLAAIKGVKRLGITIERGSKQ